MPKIIAVAIQKGGTGKTTVTFNLAAALTKKGKNVLMVDADPQGDLSRYAGYTPDGLPTLLELLDAEAHEKEIDFYSAVRTNAEKIDYIPSSQELAMAEKELGDVPGSEKALSIVLKNQAFEGYEYIFIDCPPTLSYLLVNAMTAASSVLMPVEVAPFALEAIPNLVQSIRRAVKFTNPKLKIEGIIATKCKHTKLTRDVLSYLDENYGQVVFTTRIPDLAEAPDSTKKQRSLVSLNGRLGKIFESLAEEFLLRQNF